MLQNGSQSGGVDRFSVYEVATGARTATTLAATGHHSASAGIDDLGRVYVSVSHGLANGESRLDEIRMYDPRSNR